MSEMITLQLTNEQARALRAVVNLTGKHNVHIDAASVEEQAAQDCLMSGDAVHDAMRAVWEMVRVVRKEAE